MLSALEISRMSRQEKLRILEALWTDLSQDDADIESPAWHEGILKETEARLQTGQEDVEDWEAAKRQLRKRFE
jgi:hypothetical protein